MAQDLAIARVGAAVSTLVRHDGLASVLILPVVALLYQKATFAVGQGRACTFMGDCSRFCSCTIWSPLAFCCVGAKKQGQAWAIGRPKDVADLVCHSRFGL